MLKNNKLKIVSDLEYPDHYQYSQKDFKEILNKAKKYHAKIITTEKDYLRLDFFNFCSMRVFNSKREIVEFCDAFKTEKKINFLKINE